MRIDSRDRNSFITLERRNEGGFMLLAVEAALGEFTARSRSVLIEDAASFLRELEAFERTRRGQAALRGHEDGFELRLQALDSAGHFWIGVRLTRRISPADGAEPLLLSGGFPFDSDHAAGLFADLRALLR